MLPGIYLEMRRLMAGHSLSSLAREVLALTGFGINRAESDFRRLRMLLISAEQGSINHTAARLDVIRNFVPLDPGVYFRLIEGEHVEGLCGLCACSFHDPCVMPVSPVAPLGASTCRTGDGLCSTCAETLSRFAPSRARTVSEQLRELQEQMRRFETAGATAAAISRMVEKPFLRLIPNTGEN